MTQENVEQVSQESVSEVTEPSTVETPAVEQPTQGLEELEQALADAEERGRRSGQSSKDKEVAGRDAYWQGQMAPFQRLYSSLDEEQRRQIDTGRMQNELSMYRQANQPQGVDIESFLVRQAEAVGIKKDDSRLDWATDTTNPEEGIERFNKSLGRAVKEDGTKEMSNLRKELKADQEAFERKVRSDLELESHDTSVSAGTGGGSDADFLTKYGEGEIPDTPENRKRAEKLLT